PELEIDSSIQAGESKFVLRSADGSEQRIAATQNGLLEIEGSDGKRKLVNFSSGDSLIYKISDKDAGKTKTDAIKALTQNLGEVSDGSLRDRFAGYANTSQTWWKLRDELDKMAFEMQNETAYFEMHDAILGIPLSSEISSLTERARFRRALLDKALTHQALL